MKKKKETKHKTVRISGRRYDLIFDPTQNGGHFATMTEDGKGSGYVMVGTKCKDSQLILETLLHEIIEATLAVDNRRWKDELNDHSPMIFSFDHTYLTEFTSKILDSLISSGALDMEEKECCS
jgi:hypothetical protein